MAKKAKEDKFLTQDDFEATPQDLDGIFGDDTPYRALTTELWSDIPFWCPTGASSLDFAIGGYVRGRKGGVPHRRAMEIWGPESSGKSVLLDHIIKNWCKLYGVVLLADSENSHEEYRLLQIGMGPYLNRIRYIHKPVKIGDKTVFVNDYTLEEFFDLTEKGVAKIREKNTSIPILIALDSLAYLATDAQKKAQAEGERMSMKLQLDMSRVLSMRFDTFCAALTKNNCALVIVNQFRQKPDATFKDPDYSPGGNTKNHAFSIRVKLDAGRRIYPSEDPTREHEGDDAVGIMCSFEVNKNKVAPPFRRGRFALYFDDRGIFPEETFAHLILDRKKFNYCDDFEKSGSWYSWKGERLGQGVNDMIRTFVTNPEIMAEMEGALFLDSMQCKAEEEREQNEE